MEEGRAATSLSPLPPLRVDTNQTRLGAWDIHSPEHAEKESSGKSRPIGPKGEDTV